MIIISIIYHYAATVPNVVLYTQAFLTSSSESHGGWGERNQHCGGPPYSRHTPLRFIQIILFNSHKKWCHESHTTHQVVTGSPFSNGIHKFSTKVMNACSEGQIIQSLIPRQFLLFQRTHRCLKFNIYQHLFCSFFLSR